MAKAMATTPIKRKNKKRTWTIIIASIIIVLVIFRLFLPSIVLRYVNKTLDEMEEYKKDLKQLLKKYRTLAEDLDVVKKVLRVNPDERPPFSFRINDLGLETCVVKVKKIACRALKGRGVNSGLRLIYAWFEVEQRIVMVELYHKNEKENEDRNRINRHFK